MFLVVYALTSLLAFIGRELHPGSLLPRCAAPHCRYDLDGLDPDARCPECGSSSRERTPDHHELVLRHQPLVPWFLTLLVVALLLNIDPHTLALAVRVPMSFRDHFLYRGRVLDPEIDPLFIAAALAPLAAKFHSRWRATTAIILILLTGYALAAHTAMRL